MELAVNKNEFQEAYELNQRIIAAAQMAQKSLYEMCVLLKQMRDGKKYKVLGYDNFEEYCENEVGIRRDQGTKYAKIGEEFFDKNAESTRHFEALGTEKLYLLARLDEQEREEIQQAVNVEDVSVRELKAEIARLKEEKQKADKAAADANQQRIAMQSDLLSAKSKNRSLSHELDEAKKMSGDAKGLAARLKDVERELSIADQDNYNKLEAQRIEYQKKINALQKQIDDAGKMREVAVETVEVPATKEIFEAYCGTVRSAFEQLAAFVSTLDKTIKQDYVKEVTGLLDQLDDDLYDII